MLKIIFWLAGILGILLLLLLLLFLLALLLPIRMEADKAADGPLHLVVRYGPLRIPLLPRRKKTRKPAKPAPPPKTEPQTKKRGISLKGIDWVDALLLALDMLLELRDRLRLPRLRVEILFSAGDAAKTGVLLGRAAAISGMILPLLEQNFVIRDFRIYVDGDFQEETVMVRTSLGITAAFRPIHLPLTAWKFRRKILPLLRALRSGGNGAENEDQSPNMEKENPT